MGKKQAEPEVTESALEVAIAAARLALSSATSGIQGRDTVTRIRTARAALNALTGE